MNHILRLCVKSFSHLGENEIKCWNEENSDISNFRNTII